jgi:hypothetical protein
VCFPAAIKYWVITELTAPVLNFWLLSYGQITRHCKIGTQSQRLYQLCMFRAAFHSLKYAFHSSWHVQ